MMRTLDTAELNDVAGGFCGLIPALLTGVTELLFGSPCKPAPCPPAPVCPPKHGCH